MRTRYAILAAVAVVASSGAFASIDFGCVNVDLDRPRPVCAGTLAPLGVTVDNACSEAKRVAVTFTLDTEPLRAQTASTVQAKEQLRKPVMVELPDSVAPGTHTLTVTARDIEGNANSMSMRVIVQRCPTAGL
jgi:hypothetical protein